MLTKLFVNNHFTVYVFQVIMGYSEHIQSCVVNYILNDSLGVDLVVDSEF